MADKSTLIIRHLPSELSSEDKESLLKHFGATRIRSFSDNSQLKHTAFAAFEDPEAASSALHRLHQLEVLGCRLSVEFSKSTLKQHHPSFGDPECQLKKEELQPPKEKDTKTKTFDKYEVQKGFDSISTKFAIDYQYNPKLHYLYPAPTVGILTNIANSLASTPKLYVQVLHLMNKMNIPPPFHHVTPTPPLPEDLPRPEDIEPVQKEPPHKVVETTSEESEIESDEEKSTPSVVKNLLKRPAKDAEKPRKRLKLQNLLAPEPKPDSAQQPTYKPDEVFEQAQIPVAKKIELKLPSGFVEPRKSTNMPESLYDELLMGKPVEHVEVDGPLTSQDHISPRPELPAAKEVTTPTEGQVQEVVVQEGFGKIAPIAVIQDEGSDSDGQDEEWGATEFISSRQLRKGRLSRSEMDKLNIFKNYSSGEPTTRLYIKNVGKQTTEKDLHHVYGRYVKWEDDLEKNMFDIRLMKEGRMKGQAFITLPNEASAKDALRDTNGFTMHDKPIVVQFARSAKPKEKATSK